MRFDNVMSILFLLVPHGSRATSGSHFVQEEMCDVEESINRGCSIEVHGARSSIECTILCWRDKECVGASLDAQGRCLHHQLCHTSVPCPGPDVSTHRYMARYCVHGTWDSSTHSCVCHYGTFGERCNQYHSGCNSLLTSVQTSGFHQVILDPLEDGINLIKIVCGIGLPSYSTNLLLRNSGGLDFNRTWDKYVNGFIDNIDNFWVGLRAAHILGEVGLKNMIALVAFTTGGSVYGDFRDFAFGNEEEGYPFSYSLVDYASSSVVPLGYYAGDCLSSLQDVPFSTWDRDQDGSVGENCASLAGSGWWYKDASCDIPCNLLGWGLDNYEATPPRQRLTYVGVDVAKDPSLIKSVDMYLV